MHDVTGGANNHISLIADNAKLLRKKRSDDDRKELKSDLNTLQECSKPWDRESNEKMQCVRNRKDMGVIIHYEVTSRANKQYTF